jgi:hypothetical protein
MPYRRLPNTDSSRLRAMKFALKKSKNTPPFELSFSVSLYQKLRVFYPEFKQLVQMQKETYERQVKQSKLHQDNFKKAHIYISHFIQVLDFAIIRGELPVDTRSIFKLDVSEIKLPKLDTDEDIITWGENLIKGEAKRSMSGLAPITNPNIARVKVHFEDYLKVYKNYMYLQDAHNRVNDKLVILRKEADDIIVNIWNEIEEHYSHLPVNERRVVSEEYGLVYVYRKNEKIDFKNINF